MQCWICESNYANSSEHKFKSSDLRSSYGRKFKQEVLLIRDNQELLLHSYKDDAIKHSKTICEKCNNQLTQEADNSYDFFIKYIPNQFENIKSQGSFDYKEIYSNWENGKDNLHRYFAKQAGCRIAKFDTKLIPSNLSKFILGKERNFSLKLLFVQKEGIQLLKYLHNNNNSKFLHMANGSTFLYKSKNYDCFHGWYSYDWITIHWFCGDFEDLFKFNRCETSIELVEYQKLNVEERNESIHPIDWIESFGLKEDNDRIKFINKVLG